MVKANNFKQCNLIAAVERANDLLSMMKSLQLPLEVQQSLCTRMSAESAKEFDYWEKCSWEMAYVEVTERIIREDDPSVESYPVGFNGGFPNA